MKAIDAVGKKVTRNSLKMPNSYGCPIHFQSEFRYHPKLNIHQDSVSISSSGGASSHATWQKSALRLQLAGTELSLIHT